MSLRKEEEPLQVPAPFGYERAASVEHAPWPLRAATVGSIAESLTDAAGLSVEGSPLAHFSWGVHVRVGRLRPAPRADQAVLTQ